MKKFFNTAGPCRAHEHYMIDPLTRIGDIRSLIDESQYFVVHAPRQTGKITVSEMLAAEVPLEIDLNFRIPEPRFSEPAKKVIKRRKSWGLSS